MIKNYSVVLKESIREEKSGTWYDKPDKIILNEMFKEIKKALNVDIQYLSEIDDFHIKGSGDIIIKYYDRFKSETIRAYLLGQIVLDNVKNRTDIALRAYLHFKESDEYISARGEPAPCHIYIRYDNALKRCKPRKLKAELLSLANNPRDAFYLPLTMRMLASWKIPEMHNILLKYGNSFNVTAQDVSLPEDNESYYPTLPFIKRELIFTAIDGLKYYLSDDSIRMINDYVNAKDDDIKQAAIKTLNYWKKMKISESD